MPKPFLFCFFHSPLPSPHYLEIASVVLRLLSFIAFGFGRCGRSPALLLAAGCAGAGVANTCVEPAFCAGVAATGAFVTGVAATGPCAGAGVECESSPKSRRADLRGPVFVDAEVGREGWLRCLASGFLRKKKDLSFSESI